jgi:hypothetical protein
MTPDVTMSSPDMWQTLYLGNSATHAAQLGTSQGHSLARRHGRVQVILLYTHVQYQCGTGGSYVEKPAETQTRVQLASHLVRAPNSKSGGREFGFQHGLEPGALITWNDRRPTGCNGSPRPGAAGGVPVPVPFLPVGSGRVSDEEGIMGVPGRVLLGLEQGVKVPEAALHVVVGRHLGEAELKEDLPVFRPHLNASTWIYHTDSQIPVEKL